VNDLNSIYFALLRIALNVSAELCLPRALTEREWLWVHDFSVKQCLVGLAFCAIEKLPNAQRPPRELLLRWSLEAHQVQLVNGKMNSTAARLTTMFTERGLHPVILKGQANARLYPNPLSRQAGDIDILIEGGRGGVVKTLKDMGFDVEKDDNVSDHHVHLDAKLFDGITIEVHFEPTSCNSPIKTRRMRRFLAQELEGLGECGEGGVDRGEVAAPEGFFAPGIAFALVMQLSHLRQHFFSTGIGLRQLADYHQLLVHSTPQDRARVAEQLRKFGLYNMARAVMWVMRHVFGLSDEHLLCAPHEKRGKTLLTVIMNGGNFGRYASDYNVPVFKRWLIDRKRTLKLFAFDPSEILWHELRYWIATLSLMPRRLKRGRVALGDR